MGRRFCSLDQTHSECEGTLVQIMSFRPQNRVKTKKESSRKIKEFLSPKSSENQKKSSPQFGTKFSRNLLDLFGLTGPFSSDQTALKSRWGDAESRWGDAKFRWEDANYRWGCASRVPPTI